MRKRQLGKSGLLVSELALGTWGLSGDAYGPVPEIEVDRVVDRAAALGVTLFDVADVYGGGQMLRVLGRRLAEKTTQVALKLGTNIDGYPVKQFDKTYLRMALETSLERMKRGTADILLLHNPSLASFDEDETFAYLAELRSAVQIKTWGVSTGSKAIAERAIERGAEVLEMPYNCFLFEDVRSLGTTLREKGIGLLAHSVLAYGLLAGSFTDSREFYPPDHRAERWNPEDLKERIAQLAALRAVMGGPLPTMRSVALRFALSNDRVTSAVLGPRNQQQLDQLIRDAGRAPPYMSHETLGDLERALKAYGVTGL